MVETGKENIQEKALEKTGEMPQRQTAEQTPVLFAQAVADKLDKMGEAIKALREVFIDKIDRDANASFTISDLSKRLSDHEKDYHFSINKPLILEFVDMRDMICRYIKDCKDCEQEAIRRILPSLKRHVEIVLEKYSVAMYKTREGDIFDPKKQIAVENVKTPDKKRIGRIAENITEGYYLKTTVKIIRYETVKVFVKE